ncbi:hypothetical protein [Mesobacillus maritimus]|uniref:hypothetical protein n=1 Tax=Mesobacillus maritimus TaxID=1643336 RepID=UPI00384D5AEE
MKVLIIGFSKLGYMPYLNFYLNNITEKENEIHVIYWNRDEKEDINLPYELRYHEFKLFQEDEVAKAKKVKSFIKYRYFVKNILDNEQFDLIIGLTTIPCILLYDVLIKDYNKRYILDYRDVTYENIKFYKKMLHKLVDNSVATFVSSNAFRDYLPANKNIYTTHNIILDSLTNRSIRKEKLRKREPIRIRYWGFIRHERINKAIISRIANDGRFELHYHGREQETAQNLKEFCRINDVQNVHFHGEYKPNDRYKFAEETDIIHNLFDNDKTMQSAMANKFYDAIALYIPQLCNRGSFMGEQVEKNKVGFECNPYNQDFADNLYNYYNSISWDIFEQKCNHLLSKIMVEYNNGINVLNNIFMPMIQSGKINNRMK